MERNSWRATLRVPGALWGTALLLLCVVQGQLKRWSALVAPTAPLCLCPVLWSGLLLILAHFVSCSLPESGCEQGAMMLLSGHD